MWTSFSQFFSMMLPMPNREERRRRLHRRVEYWAKRLKVEPRVVRVQKMTRKWGSCSTRGIVTLADDLAGEPRGFQDFVVAHELLHLRVHNHGKVFKALMSLHVPDWRKHDMSRLYDRRTNLFRATKANKHD